MKYLLLCATFKRFSARKYLKNDYAKVRWAKIKPAGKLVHLR